MTNIMDHLSVGVPSISEATSFYNGLLETLGVSLLAETEGFAAYGVDTPQFLVMVPENAEAYSVGNGVHICFKAQSKEAVEAFHSFAMNNSGVCAGKPGPRAAYPKPDVFTCFVRDPFGNKLEAIFNGFAA